MFVTFFIMRGVVRGAAAPCPDGVPASITHIACDPLEPAFDEETNTITVLVVVLVAAVVLILLDLIFGGAIHLLIGA